MTNKWKMSVLSYRLPRWCGSRSLVRGVGPKMMCVHLHNYWGKFLMFWVRWEETRSRDHVTTNPKRQNCSWCQVNSHAGLFPTWLKVSKPQPNKDKLWKLYHRGKPCIIAQEMFKVCYLCNLDCSTVAVVLNTNHQQKEMRHLLEN